MKCAHCQAGKAKRRGLCYRCHADRSIRDRYPSRFVIRKHEGPRCLHCSIRKQKRQSRGLCYRCYLDVGVRNRFQKKVTRCSPRTRQEKDVIRSNLKPCKPMPYLPKTPEWFEVKRQRVLDGEELWHDDDARREDE